VTVVVKSVKPTKLGKVDPSIVYRLFNPHVPVIVCSKFGKEVAAMPANSCSPVSESPSLISLALRRGIRTNHVVQRSFSFSINWLSFEPKESRKIILDLARPFESRPLLDGADKLKASHIPYFLVNDIPILSRAFAFAICSVKKRIMTGDHDLFISSVISVKASSDFTREGYWSFRDYKPVLYVGSVRKNPLITISRAASYTK
jgi:flavin reductase (DIM6/NTAB) family NADH-FMN oxidoreductase RutF